MAKTIEFSRPLETDADVVVGVTTFTANGEYLVGGTLEDVRVWRVKDGKQVVALKVNGGAVPCVAASRDGRWIAAGTYNGGSLFIWNTTAYERPERVFAGRTGCKIYDIDFSLDSVRLVSADEKGSATIWDVVARKKVQTLDHDGPVRAVKYSPQGDRIATATGDNTGRLLIGVNVQVKGWRNLPWSDLHFFVQTNDGTIKQINAATGSTVSEWSVPADDCSRIALPQHGKFVAHSAGKAITLWDPATGTQLGLIPHTDDIFSFAFSSDDSLLAIVSQGSKTFIKQLFQSISEPELGIDGDALNAWKHGQLANAEALLSAAILTSNNRAHHILASRALIRVRLGQLDAALDDAKESIGIQRSPIGYIAKCMAFVAKGEKDKGLHVCDIAVLHFHSEYVTFFILIKIVAMFVAGERVNAISRMNDLIADGGEVYPVLYIVLAYMHLLLGNFYLENNDYERAIQSFKDARIRLGSWSGKPPLIVSLISGWEFDDLAIPIQQRLSETLLTVGRTREAGECVLRMVDQEINLAEHIKTWVSDFKSQCREKLEDLGDGAMNVKQYDEAILHYTAVLSLNPAAPQGLLVKRSNAWAGKGARDNALNDAKEWARLILTSYSWKDALAAADGFLIGGFAVYRVVCEHLETTGRIIDAVACLCQISSEQRQEIDGEADWICDLKSKCRVRLKDLGDSAMNAKRYDEAVSQYTVALSLSLASPEELLMKRSNALVGKGACEDALNDTRKWASFVLTSSSWKDALAAADGFLLERFTVWRAVCEHLETVGRNTDAIACFHHMSSELVQKMDEGQVNWTRNFKSRSRRRLEDLGDSAMNARQYEEAISQYSAALSLDPVSPQDLLVKQSKAHAETGKWEDALNEANEVIKIDPSSSSGYERKYAALLGMGHHDEAIGAFETMLSKMSESSDPEVREQSCRYVSPEHTESAIRTSIQNAIRDSPTVLINTASGRLCNKSEQAAAFESTPAFTRLITSMTKHINLAFIEQVVGEFYRYATFSHTWEGNEPLYEKVLKIVVYDLEASPTHEKLRMFCKVVRDEGFNWAWSDTCCINQVDHFVLQEALVSMFKWYEGSAMTIIFLCDVDRLAEAGALIRSKWNSRGWTLQEYHASKVVRIYTRDWTPYLGLTIYNHKESPEIISEMEQATDISAQALVALRPGLNDIREKLRLASTRQTTRVEDAAYSLLGIFSMSLPVTYGEGDKALGRLLSQLLMSSGDTSILAWTGKPGGFNSCLPTNIIVFNHPLTSWHISLPILDAEMEAATAERRVSSLDHNLVTSLYDRVNGLPTPTFAGQRMRLPCLAFKIRLVSVFQNGPEYVLRAQTGALGTVEIRTRQKLMQSDSLYLVHPWVDFLLDRRAGKTVEIAPDLDEFTMFSGSSNVTPPAPRTRTARLIRRLWRVFGRRPAMNTTSLPREKQMRNLQFIARLRQPFGALLLTSTRQNVAEYRRVATESLITVQVGEITSAMLDELIQGVRVLDVL